MATTPLIEASSILAIVPNIRVSLGVLPCSGHNSYMRISKVPRMTDDKSAMI